MALYEMPDYLEVAAEDAWSHRELPPLRSGVRVIRSTDSPGALLLQVCDEGRVVTVRMDGTTQAALAGQIGAAVA